MRAQVGRHFAHVSKQRGKRRSIRGQQRIFQIEYIKVSRAVVGVDDDLNAVAYIIDVVVVDFVMTRVWVVGGFGECVDDPVKLPIVSGNDVRVPVVNQKWRDTVNDFANVSMDQ